MTHPYGTRMAGRETPVLKARVRLEIDIPVVYFRDYEATEAGKATAALDYLDSDPARLCNDARVTLVDFPSPCWGCGNPTLSRDGVPACQRCQRRKESGSV